LSERISNLFAAVEGANARPTAVQAAYLIELRQEFAAAINGVNSYLGETAPELNTLFERYQLPRVLIPGLIEF